MATTKYRLLLNGQYVTETGATTDFPEQAASFTSVTAAKTFIESTGQAGEYRVMTLIDKA